MIGLLDANNFYASCERVFRPDLLRRPVAILSNNDGCIIARSAEVKALGIPMGVPYFQVKKLLADHQAAVFSSNFSLYGDMSGRMMALLGSLAPSIEVYSIDEAFIDFSGIKDVKGLALQIRQQVRQVLGLPTCIGIGQTKTLAKVANQLAKKEEKHQSVCMLVQEEDIDQALRNMKAGDIWGIGRRLSEHLNGFNIHTGLDLKRVDPRWMRRHFTVVGERVVQELNGISCSRLEEVEQPKKSIQVSRSFAHSITDFEELRSVVATYATRLGAKLRHRQLKAQSLMVSLCTNRHHLHAPQHAPCTTIAFPCPVEDDLNLVKASTKVLESLFRQGFAYRKAGVMAMGLLPRAEQVQWDLLSPLPTEDPRCTRLFEAVDQINRQYGRGTLFSAACGKKISWKDQKSHLSPAYTTRWQDLPTVFAR